MGFFVEFLEEFVGVGVVGVYVDALEGVLDGLVGVAEVALDPGDALGVAVVVEFDLVESR